MKSYEILHELINYCSDLYRRKFCGDLGLHATFITIVFNAHHILLELSCLRKLSWFLYCNKEFAINLTCTNERISFKISLQWQYLRETILNIYKYVINYINFK